MASETYAAFAERIKEIRSIGAIQELLEWDQQTYMPKKGAGIRADQIGLLASLAHEKLISHELGALLDKLEAEEVADDPIIATNVRETRRAHDRAVKLPTELVEQIARATSRANEAWQAARTESEFSRFAPHLETLLELKRRVAEHIGYESEPYDALMDEFEPNAKAAEVEAVFAALRPELVKLVDAIRSAPQQPDTGLLEREAPVDKQAEFNRLIAAEMGFDFEAGRIDVSTHPFCSGFAPSDVRMTTRYDKHAVARSLFGVMHETGHALYEQGMDPAHAGTPMATWVSLGIHESQSRMWENMVGRSRPFWRHYWPKFQAHFPAFADVPADDWYFAINTVRPSLIRVEADEVTYGLHIMLRFAIERQMIRGELAVADVPAQWNDMMQDFLGVTPRGDADGCLQDIHWSLGIFGYFPTYALGNLYAAQFFAAARRDTPDLHERIERGELAPLREWLRDKIHRHGRHYRADELLKNVTGERLSHEPFIAYLRAKYQPLYGF